MDSKLCDDMLKIEILSRTSLKSLDIMRCINKEFEKLTYEPYLLNLYKQRNDIVSGFFTKNKKLKFAPSHGSNNIDLSFLPRDAKIRASSEQGIMVFESPHPRNYKLILYYVCKPTTKQVLALPNPKTKYFTEKVAIIVMGSNPLHYKIVRLSACSSKPYECNTTYRCEIFDSRTWAWKLLDVLKFPIGVFPTNSQTITTRGSIYMLLSNNEIFKFDAYSEEWTIFSSPKSTLDYESSQLIKHERRLGFACRSSDCFWEIWLLRIDELWEKIYVFSKEEDINAKKLFNDPNTSIVVDFNTILFYTGNTISKVVLSDLSYETFVFRSDLEPANLTGREK